MTTTFIHNVQPLEMFSKSKSKMLLLFSSSSLSSFEPSVRQSYFTGFDIAQKSAGEVASVRRGVVVVVVG